MPLPVAGIATARCASNRVITRPHRFVGGVENLPLTTGAWNAVRRGYELLCAEATGLQKN